MICAASSSEFWGSHSIHFWTGQHFHDDFPPFFAVLQAVAPEARKQASGEESIFGAQDLWAPLQAAWRICLLGCSIFSMGLLGKKLGTLRNPGLLENLWPTPRFQLDWIFEDKPMYVRWEDIHKVTSSFGRGSNILQRGILWTCNERYDLLVT